MDIKRVPLFCFRVWKRACILGILILWGCASVRIQENAVIKNLAVENFEEVWQVIQEKFIRSLPDTPEVKRICKQKIIEQNIAACLDDPHAQYLSQEKWNTFQEDISQQFHGVGIILRREGNRGSIAEILPNTPAERSGAFRTGDVVVSIDGKDVQGMPLDALVEKVRGLAGTEVMLQVERDGIRQKPVTLTREEIIRSSVFVHYFAPDIVYIRIESFALHTGDEFFAAMMREKFTVAHPEWAHKYFIYDLRENKGGYAGIVNVMNSFFADDLDDVLLTLRSRTHEEITTAGFFIWFMTVYGDTIGGVFSDVNPPIVLINEYTASAAEIFAGFLREERGAILVGEKSYGKGSVQTIQELANGDVMMLTTHEYFVGNSRIKIDKLGLTPDITIPMPSNEYLAGISLGRTPDVSMDLPLKVAIELLRMFQRH